MTVEDPERPFLTRSLRVPDRVAMHLLGDDHLDAALPLLADIAPTAGPPRPSSGAVARALAAGATLVYLRERGRGTARARRRRARCAARPRCRWTSPRLGRAATAPETGRACRVREARLRGAGIVAARSRR